MPSTIEAEETIRIGHETLVASKSPITEYGVFFEDDGETGYFYGLDTSRSEGKQILDALHIYNVGSVMDKEKPSHVTSIPRSSKLSATTSRVYSFNN